MDVAYDQKLPAILMGGRDGGCAGTEDEGVFYVGSKIPRDAGFETVSYPSGYGYYAYHNTDGDSRITNGISATF